MKKALQLFAFLLCLPILSSAQNVYNLYVLQAGDGSAALSSASTAIFLKEYSRTALNQTAPNSTITIPTTGPARLTLSGTATSEGQLQLSQDSTRFVIAGYDTTVGIASIAGSASISIARAIDTVGYLGIPGKVDTTNSAFSGNNIRSATKANTNNYWAVGGNSGVFYFGSTAPKATVFNATTNLRVIRAKDSSLYFSTSSGLPRIGRINSQPTSGIVNADTLINIGTGASPYDFAINPANNVVYVADDRTTGPGGIQKWVLSGTTWSLAYTLSVGASSGARGIAVEWLASPVLYATAYSSSNTGGRLVKIIDTGALSKVDTLAMAPTNTAFRGVSFGPKACTSPTLSASVTPFDCIDSGAITLTVSNGTPNSYSWTGPNNYTANTQNISNLVPGTYQVTATVAGGCTTTLSVVVSDSSNFNATITPANDTSICSGDTLWLSANTGAGYQYQWLNANNSINGAVASTYGATMAGTYKVAMALGNNCKDTSSAIVLTLNSLPMPTVTYVSNRLRTENYFTGYQWYYNGNTIAGATDSIHIPTANGSYKVCVKDTLGCTNCSNDFTVSDISSIEEALTQNGVEVYPNPTSSIIHIVSNKPVHTRLLDATGKVITTTKGSNKLNVATLSDGLYLLEVSDANGKILGYRKIQVRH